MSITIKVRPKWRVPDTGRFVQILHDFQTAEWNYQPRCLTIGYNEVKNPTGSYPDTFYMPGMKPNDFYPLSPAWQWAWYHALGVSLDGWQWLTRHGVCFTDNHAVEQGFTDYVSSVNLDASKPIQVKSLVLGGNICKVIDEDDTRYYVEAFDLSQPPPLVDVSQPWRVHIATQTTKDADVLPFPQAGGKDVVYLLPSIGGVNKINKQLARPIANGAIYNPYENYS